MPLPVAVPLPRGTDPAAVYAVLSTDAPHTFWLDAGPAATSGWSWVGTGVSETRPERVREVEVARTHPAAETGPFRGGWVGWIGYEAGAAEAGAPVHPLDPPVPVEVWLRVAEWIAFDHATGRAWALGPSGRAEELAARVRGASVPAAPPDPPARAATVRHTPEEYAALIERCRDRIRDGDAYQLCLTTRFEVSGVADPETTYARLRHGAPSHHGGIVRSGGTALLSASPERFLEIADGVVRTHPIKGTRRRSADAETDEALLAELRADPKEQAENVMIVDLMRNDLSRVCAPGTVAVERLLEVESYPTVHQLVSTVAGRLAPGTTLGEVLGAAFPAGSMTGAPKLSAMTILAGLEGAARGLFAGCYGWVGEDGSADLAMVIRSIVLTPGRAVVGAGGGITWRSVAAAEVAEVGLKARAPLAALGAAVPPGWGQ